MLKGTLHFDNSRPLCSCCRSGSSVNRMYSCTESLVWIHQKQGADDWNSRPVLELPQTWQK